jgi:hypothetical protein
LVTTSITTGPGVAGVSAMPTTSSSAFSLRIPVAPMAAATASGRIRSSGLSRVPLARPVAPSSKPGVAHDAAHLPDPGGDESADGDLD